MTATALTIGRMTPGKEYESAELVVKVTKSDTYTAIFTDSKPEVMVTADSWLGGTVTCNGTVVKPTTDTFKLGETLHLTAKAHPGFLFWGWYVNGRLKSLKHETSLVAKARGKTGHCVITAAFVPIDTVCVPLAVLPRRHRQGEPNPCRPRRGGCP